MLRDTAGLLHVSDLTIVGSTRDFSEFTPFRATTLYRLVGGEPLDTRILPREAVAVAPPPAVYTSREYWQAVWKGAARDERALAIIVDTVAAALLTMPTCPISNFEAADLAPLK